MHYGREQLRQEYFFAVDRPLTVFCFQVILSYRVDFQRVVEILICWGLLTTQLKSFKRFG
jgi:hypothetical protein